MGYLFKRNRAQQKRELWGVGSVGQLIPNDPATYRQYQAPVVGPDRALQHSAVWAAVRLRADLISTLPLDVYTMANGLQVPAPKPAVLVSPAGDSVSMEEWLYSSQVELDRTGNSIGVIRGRDSKGYPTQIDLKPTSACQVLVSAGQLTGYKVEGKPYPVDQVWHEKQYTISGLHVGLSPVAYAAWTLGEWQSVQEFAYSWFCSSAVPRSALKNTQRELDPGEALDVKESWRASQAIGEPFVHGADWEYSMIQAQQNAADFVAVKQFSLTDIARYFGVPVDLIDGAVQGKSVTYANIGQRNLQFLVLQLGPAIVRRERALSKLIPGQRFVKFNSDALLRMDPQTRSEMLRSKLESHQITVSEARALENLPPFTTEQEAETLRYFPPRNSQPPAAAA